MLVKALSEAFYLQFHFQQFISTYIVLDLEQRLRNSMLLVSTFAIQMRTLEVSFELLKGPINIGKG